MKDEEILEALSRSGYLLESEIAKNLSRMGYFVESNQTIKDPFTNKSREIDLTAEYFGRYKPIRKRCATKIRYIFEIKNNIYPVVLLTEYQYTPNSIFEDAWKAAQTIPNDVIHDSTNEFHDYLFPAGVYTPLFTQYCSFQKKKGSSEFMAIHPDELHEGLSKITQFAEEEIEFWNTDSENETFYRSFLYLPIVLLNDELYELNIDEENNSVLKNVGVSRLMFNYHFNGHPKSAIVYFVTKAALDFFLEDMVKIEDLILENMIKLHTSGV